MRRLSTLAVVVIASLTTIFVAGASAAVSPNSQEFGGTNGRVYSIITLGNTVYVGGKFTQVTGTNGTMARNNLAAFTTAGAVTSWNPNANADVRALATNGKRIFAGGSFTTVHGAGSKHVAAISLAGLRIWGGGADNVVRALRMDNTRLLVGGTFQNVQGKKRHRLAALSPKTGVVGTWNPDADHPVDAIVVGPSRVYIGGEFRTINGKSERHLVAINRNTNAIVPFPHPAFPVFALALAGRLYVGGSGAGGWLTAFATTGHRDWQVRVDGGVAAVSATANQIIVGGHFNNYCIGGTAAGGPTHCTNPGVRHHLLSVGIGGAVQSWAPDVNSALGVFATRAVSGNLYVGGDFTSIGAPTRNHLARFTYS